MSDLGDVSLVAFAIHGVCTFAGLSQEKASLVELSIVEAVTNSIKHAYHGEPGGRLIIKISLDEQYLTFDLYDRGSPIPANQVERLVQGKGMVESTYSDYTSIPESGRGLEIIHKTMDKISYGREDGQNHLTLATYLGAA
jgi:serine/threonine-protein kinase RsbW